MSQAPLVERLREAGNRTVNNNFSRWVSELLFEAADALPQWQPIETAPKDGTRVLVFDAAWCGGNPKRTVSYWQRYERIDDGSRQQLGSWSGVTAGTHWMPLPAIPAKDPA